MSMEFISLEIKIKIIFPKILNLTISNKRVCSIRTALGNVVSTLFFLVSFKTLRKRCPYSKLFWSAFSLFWSEYWKIQSISPCLIQTRENADQNNFEYGHFLRSEKKTTLTNFHSNYLDMLLRMLNQRSIDLFYH